MPVIYLLLFVKKLLIAILSNKYTRAKIRIDNQFNPILNPCEVFSQRKIQKLLIPIMNDGRFNALKIGTNKTIPSPKI